MGDTPRSQTVSTKLQRIAEQARRYPQTVFTNLIHLVDVDFLREAHRLTRKDAAPGIDGVTPAQYSQNLEENLRDLHQRMREGRYVAPGVQRCWIIEDEGKERPIGITTYEDKIVQRSVVMLLSALYDQDFYDFSYGFIKGRSQHQALVELRNQCMENDINWIVDADVSGFFDNLERGQLRAFMAQRVNDGGIKRLIGKWLNAGVLEGEKLSYPDKGTVQGGVVSPLLANIYLHQVLDEWFVKEVKPRMRGRSFLIRFADDFIIGCELETDAQRIMRVLPKRFNRFGLSIHPTKTRLVEFSKPPYNQKAAKGKASFAFLGFTHYWARSRRGYWIIKRKTEAKRLGRFMKRLWRWCKANRHEYLKDQHRELCAKLRGYYQYYGIRGNYKALEAVFEWVERAWRYWLSRRSHKGYINWEKFDSAIRNVFPLPKPRIIHRI